MEKILIVDDTGSFRLAMSAFLRRKGFEVICATNGLEGLEQATLHRPDLILLDIAMPAMDGMACLKRIREIECLKATPVVIVTAMSEFDVISKADLGSANKFLFKSQFTLVDLMDTITAQLAAGKSVKE